MSKRNYTIPLLDMLFITLLGVTVLFILNATANKIEESKADIETKAEYVITVTWPEMADRRSDDVDTWLKCPNGSIVHYRKKDNGLAHLDRDDLGFISDTVNINGQYIHFPWNQEIMTIRQPIAGEWILNVHLYKRYTDQTETPVTVEMRKLNPTVQIVLFKQVKLLKFWEEITISSFMMSNKGNILSWDDTPRKLVKVQ